MKGVVKINVVISNKSELPIYEQISNQLKNHIITGELNSGDILPSIRKLAKELQISVITTKRAYEELERNGFITTVPGKGSYVAHKSMELLKESQLKIIEQNLLNAINASKQINLSKNELVDILMILYKEEIDE